MAVLFWFIVPALAAACLAFVLAPLAARLAVRIGAVDMPGDRKVHTAPIPRLGGLAVVASIALVLAGLPWLAAGRWQLPSDLAMGLALGVLPVFLISLLDDIATVGAPQKLLAHTLGAVIAVAAGISLEPVVHLFGAPIHIGVLAAPLSVLWIIGVTNAFNLIDGLDGLSVGLALIAASSMAAVFFLVGQAGMGGVVLVLAGALVGFLPYNIHPARLFLGDAGATSIGFCLAAFALRGGSTLSSGFAALLPVFMLGLPIADTLITMARRIVSRSRNREAGVFVADHNHIHHRLLALGIDHRKAVLVLYGAGLVLAGAAFLSVFLKAREAGLFVVALLVAGFVGVQRLGYDEFAFIKRGTVLRLYELPALERGLFVVFVDVVLAVVVSYLAVGLKTDQWSIFQTGHPVRDLATTFAPVTAVVFWWFGMYRGSWRVAGLQDLTRACKAVATATILGTILVESISPVEHPLSLFAIYGIVNLVLTGSLRASYVILENSRMRAGHKGAPALIYGAGSQGVSAVRELFQNPTSEFRPIGFIDDDPQKRGKLVSDLPVFGTEGELEAILRTHAVRALFIADETVSARALERATEKCQAARASVFRLRFEVEHLSGPVTVPERGPLFEFADSGPVIQQPAPARPATVSTSVALESHGLEKCPACAHRGVHRSKARTFYETLWRDHTPKRIFRCANCGWRGWLVPLQRVVAGEAVPSPDLAALDSYLKRDVDQADVKEPVIDWPELKGRGAS